MNQKEVIILPSSHTIRSAKTVVTSTTYVKNTDNFSIPVRIGPAGEIDYCILEWDTNDLDIYFPETTATWQVSKAEIQFYYAFSEKPKAIKNITIVDINNSTKPSDVSNAQTLFDRVAAATTVYATQAISGDDKTIITVTIGDSTDDDACELLTNILAGSASHFEVAIKKTDTSITGEMQIGGQVMSGGLDESWQQSSGIILAQPPTLILTVQANDVSHVSFAMRYTTTDPSSSQQTPSNSIGGFISPNEVYSRSQINEPISSTQLSVPIDSSTSLPDFSSGLIQVGPEIMSFSSIDTSSHLLSISQRGVAPGFAFPSGTKPFGEYASYLNVDKLFDTHPSSLSRQEYRCVAFVATVQSPVSAENPQIYLIQNPDADVQIDVGIEMPLHQQVEAQISSAVSSGANIITCNNMDVASELFNGAYFTIGSTLSTFVSQHETLDSGIEQFSLENVTTQAYSAGTTCIIHAASSQRVTNKITSPDTNNGLFLGFLKDGGDKRVKFIGQLINNDAFYLWIKKTHVDNAKIKNDTGAIIMILSSHSETS